MIAVGDLVRFRNCVIRPGAEYSRKKRGSHGLHQLRGKQEIMRVVRVFLCEGVMFADVENHGRRILPVRHLVVHRKDPMWAVREDRRQARRRGRSRMVPIDQAAAPPPVLREVLPATATQERRFFHVSSTRNSSNLVIQVMPFGSTGGDRREGGDGWPREVTMLDEGAAPRETAIPQEVGRHDHLLRQESAYIDERIQEIEMVMEALHDEEYGDVLPE